MEIEAKFQLSKPEDWQFYYQLFCCQTSDLAGWQGGEEVSSLDLAAFYYDTPAADLHQAGFSLRLRREGPALFLTIKHRPGEGQADLEASEANRQGIVARQEWEVLLADSVTEQFKPQAYERLAWDRVRTMSLSDPSLLPLGKILADYPLVLQAASSFTRTRGYLHQAEAKIEWALDQGYFHHPGKADEAFAELELELKTGPYSALQALISQVQQLRPLRVQHWSKQARALHSPYDLIIVGAGPAGLAAGLGAGLKAEAEKREARILILDKGKEAGRKILASGNGRCNLSNQDADASKYLTHLPKQLEALIQQIPRKFTQNFCRDLGLALKFDQAGRAYPQAEEARAVRDLLLARLQSLKLVLAYDQEVCQIWPPELKGQTYYLQTRSGEIYRAKSLILALGSPASPALGGSWSLASLAKAWQLPYQTFRPALCGLLIDQSSSLSQVQGCRVKGKASLPHGRASQGEFLLNKGALSGIAAMDLANYLAEERGSFAGNDPQAVFIFDQSLTLTLDFFPEWQAGSLAKALADKGRSFAWQVSWDLLLASYLPSRLTRAVLRDQGLKAEDPAQAKIARSLAYQLKAYPLPLQGLKSFADAQVASGGLDLSAITQDYRLKAYPGAYVCGEALDVVGFCGGYNLHFAWASGYRAGQAALADLISPVTL